MQPNRNVGGFHPHFSTWLANPDQLERTLVSHHEVLRDFLARLRAVEQGSPANHFLLVGPRGVGKTHVICLGGHYVTGRTQRPKDWTAPSEAWVCVLFTEEEYAGQDRLANFLLTLFTKLQEVLPTEEFWQLPKGIRDGADQAVIECCFERLERFHREKGKRILVLIDNLQKVLQQWADDDHQKLRSFLSRNNLLVIFASAPSVFREVIDQKAAFHDFFEVRLLGELSNEQVLDLLSRRFREDGRQTEYEQRKDELAKKIPAIAVLTGGNPRLVLFLYEIATRSTFLDIEFALRNLIEELREYFVRRFDELPDQARKVLDTIAQMPGPATPKEIAQEARLGLALVNAQLKRLKDGHYVRPVKFQRQKSTRYDITERLFRIWRQTATVAGRQRFRFLADFLKIYFTTEEVRGLYSQHLECLRNAGGLPREEVLRHIEELYYFQAAGEGEIRYGAFSNRVEGLAKLGELRWAEEEAQYFASESLKKEDKLGIRSAYKQQALIHLKQGRYTDAVADVEKLLDADATQDATATAEKLVAENPSSAEAWICLGRVVGTQGDYVRALDAFRKAAELGEQTSALSLYQTIALNRLYRFEEALRCAERAVALDENNAQGWEELGASAGGLGDHERALAAFRKAVDVGQPSSKLWGLQGIALSYLKRPEEALKCLEQAVAMDNKYAMAWEELGILVHGAGDYERALVAFRRAAEVGQPTSELWQHQAKVLIGLRQPEEALRCLEQAIALDGKNAGAWQGVGLLAYKKGDYGRALVAFRKAVELGQSGGVLWTLQAATLNEMGQWEEVLNCAEKAVASDEPSTFAWRLLALAAHELGQLDRALSACRKAAEIGQATPELRRLEARTLLQLGRAEEGLAVLEQSLSSEGGTPELWQEKAWTLLELGRVEDALESISQARDKGATLRQYHHDRGDLLLLAGRYAEALKDLEEGLKAEPDDWDLQADRLIALACLGQLGPMMEALPNAIAKGRVPPGSWAGVCSYMHEVALNALRRGEEPVCLGLLRASLEMKSWAGLDWVGPQLGKFLRRALDIQPRLFVELLQSVRGRLKEEKVLRLLEPFLKAGEFLQTKSADVLERLFPEVRELVLDIVKRVDPDLHEKSRRMI